MIPNDIKCYMIENSYTIKMNFDFALRCHLILICSAKIT